MSNKQQGSTVSWIIIGMVVGLLVSLFIYNQANRPPVENPHLGNEWNAGMSTGNADAPNKFVEYSDYFCPYCSELKKATDDPDYKKDYIDSGKVRHETRIITVLKDMIPNTEQGAEAAFCAADQNKFYEYSQHIVPRIQTEYFDKGIGTKNVANPVPIPLLPLSYFTSSAIAVGMDVEEFNSCISGDKHSEKIRQDTQKAISAGVTGLPYIVVNDYKTSGFMGGYDGLKTVLKAGGVE